MGLLYTMTAFTIAGVSSRVISLGLQNRPLRDGIAVSGIWVATWIGLGASYHQWKSQQEQEYIRRLQYLVDRKERRDKWDRLYFQDASSQSSSSPSS